MVRKNNFLTMLSVSALALLITAAPAMAAQVDVSGENHTTGSNSDNENLFDVRHDVEIDVRNDGDVENNAAATVNTGGNVQNQNTTAGDVESGDIDASTDWESIVNVGAALMGGNHGELEVMADFSNDTTGSNSENENRLDVRNDVDVDVRNLADILNRLTLNATTGNNNQNQNTMAGDIDTGDVGLDSHIVNEANNDSGHMGSAVGSASVRSDAVNHLTGSNSENENRVNVRNNYDVNLRNNADVENRVAVTANTGNNNQNQNTTGGDVSTGDVDVSTHIVNEANNGSSLGGSPNGLEVESDFSNDTTGSNSNNENRLDVRNDVDVNVRNNADVENRLTVNATTGNNNQNQNTTSGSTKTGSVSIDFGSMTVVNSN